MITEKKLNIGMNVVIKKKLICVIKFVYLNLLYNNIMYILI